MAAVLRSRNHRAQSCHLQYSALLVLRFAFLYFLAEGGSGKWEMPIIQEPGNRGKTPDGAVCFLGGSPGQVKSSYYSRHKYKKAHLLVPGSGSSGKCAVDPSSSRRRRQKVQKAKSAARRGRISFFLFCIIIMLIHYPKNPPHIIFWF